MPAVFNPAVFGPAQAEFAALQPAAEVTSYGPADPQFPYQNRSHISFNYVEKTTAPLATMAPVTPTTQDPGHGFYGAGSVPVRFLPAPEKKRLGVGAILSIVFGSLVVLALTGLGLVWALRSANAGEPIDPDLTAGDAPAATAPAGLPEGFVLVDDETAGITYAVPTDWADVSAEVRPVMEAITDSAPEGSITISGVWASGSIEAASDQMVVIHSSHPGMSTNVPAVSDDTITGFAATVEHLVRVSEEDFATATGLPARKAVVTSEFPAGTMTTTFYTIAESTRYVNVTYSTLGGQDRSDEVRQLVDSVVIN